MEKALIGTDYHFPGQRNVYKGKVRDVYNINDELLVMIVTDRISAFDAVLPRAVPYRGQVLNQIANKFLDLTSDIIPNWKIASPDPMVTIGRIARPFKVEMVIRAYLTGHAWRQYNAGKRRICGISLPDGLPEHGKLPEPIITPTTKASAGHDTDLSREEIIESGLVDEKDYILIEKYTKKLFRRGTELSARKGLILVDTKYEFGKIGEDIVLIDEIHTPDSSRYFYAEGYEARQKNGVEQKQLSKEFVRQWLIEHGFQGKKGQQIPEMPDELVNQISERYVELYEILIGERFNRERTDNIEKRILKNINDFLSLYKI